MPKTNSPSLADELFSGVRAAQYVRMSTDHQKYSIQNQADAIAAYAARHGIAIVHSYEDAGRSGLRLNGRQGLQGLIADKQMAQLKRMKKRGKSA